jgi:hypothetical protein
MSDGISNPNTDIALWGVTGSGKTWLIHALARELAWYTDKDPDFSYSLKDSEDQYIRSLHAPTAEKIAATLEGEDHLWIFERKAKENKTSRSHQVSSHAHQILIHDNPGKDLKDALDEYAPDNDSMVSRILKLSRNIIILLDHTTLPDPKNEKSASSSENIFSKTDYERLIGTLVDIVTSNNTNVRLAVCVSKADTIKIHLPTDEYIRVMFGDGVMRAFSSSLVTKQFFRISSVGVLRSADGRKKSNIDDNSTGLKDETRWNPVNVAAPFFWLFESIERERISVGDFLGDRKKYYTPYPPPRQV